MKLDEIIYGNRKIFYHISPNKFSKFEARNNYRKDDSDASGVFLSPSMLMIYEYYHNYLLDKYENINNIFYIYRCTIKPNLNIFNPSNKHDRSMFIEIVKGDPRGFLEEFEIRSRSTNESLRSVLFKIFEGHWYCMENPVVAKIIRVLGYDGYETMENTVTNINIFNPENISIIDNGPWKETSNIRPDSKFWKQFPEIETRRSIGDNIEANKKKAYKGTEIADLDVKTSEVFSVTIVDSSGRSYDYDNLSYCFTSRGELILPKVEEIMKKFYGKLLDMEKSKDASLYLKYQGKVFNTYKDFEKFLKDKYNTVDFDPNDD